MATKNNFKKAIYATMDYSDAGQNEISAMTLFLPRCNLKCPYCMNGRLLTIKDFEYNPEMLKKFEKRARELKVSHIIISGGEPTIYPVKLLNDIVDYVKEIGIPHLGMSTNGINFKVLKDMLPRLDFVALDIKGDNWDYAKAGISLGFAKAMQSYSIIYNHKKMVKSFSYELRTTVYPEFINMEKIRFLSDFIFPSTKWILTQYRPVKNMPCKKKVKPYKDEYLEELANEARKRIKDVEVRYV